MDTLGGEGGLTRLDGLPVGEGQRCDEESALRNWHPVVENFHSPDPGPQGQVQRGLVVGEFGSGLDQDVVGGSDDVHGVYPDDGHSHVGALAPLLHAYRLVHGPQEAPKVPEETLLGVPVSADLEEENRSWDCWARAGVQGPRKALDPAPGAAHTHFTDAETEALDQLLAQSPTGR